MDEHRYTPCTAIRDLASARAQSGGSVIDDALADGWTSDKTRDSLAKAGEPVMVQVVWGALMEEWEG